MVKRERGEGERGRERETDRQTESLKEMQNCRLYRNRL